MFLKGNMSVQSTMMYTSSETEMWCQNMEIVFSELKSLHKASKFVYKLTYQSVSFSSRLQTFDHFTHGILFPELVSPHRKSIWIRTTSFSVSLGGCSNTFIMPKSHYSTIPILQISFLHSEEKYGCLTELKCGFLMATIPYLACMTRVTSESSPKKNRRRHLPRTEKLKNRKRIQHFGIG